MREKSNLPDVRDRLAGLLSCAISLGDCRFISAINGKSIVRQYSVTEARGWIPKWRANLHTHTHDTDTSFADALDTFPSRDFKSRRKRFAHDDPIGMFNGDAYPCPAHGDTLDLAGLNPRSAFV